MYLCIYIVYIYIYVYIYMLCVYIYILQYIYILNIVCVCVCVCVYIYVSLLANQMNSIVCFQKYLGLDYIYQTVSYNLWNIFATLQWIIKGKAVVKDALCCLEAFYIEGHEIRNMRGHDLKNSYNAVTATGLILFLIH